MHSILLLYSKLLDSRNDCSLVPAQAHYTFRHSLSKATRTTAYSRASSGERTSCAFFASSIFNPPVDVIFYTHIFSNTHKLAAILRLLNHIGRSLLISIDMLATVKSCTYSVASYFLV